VNAPRRVRSTQFAVVCLLAMCGSCLSACAQQPAVAAFQDALFRSTLDRGGYGRRAIDVYWAADALKNAKLPSYELNRKLTGLYKQVTGDHVIRAEITSAGWSITPPPAPFVFAADHVDQLLFIVSNATATTKSIKVLLAGDVKPWQQELELAPDESRALYPNFLAKQIGAANAHLEVCVTTCSSVLLTGEVRKSVHVQITIQDTQGKQTAARLYVKGDDGRSYTPDGAFDRVMWMTGEHYSYTPGNASVTLPDGSAEFEIRKGFDYLPVVRQVHVRAGISDDFVVQLKWLSDFARKGWFSGDDHIHGNYTGEQWSTPENANLVISGEGLHVGNMVVANSTGAIIHDERYFEGKPNELSSAYELLYWNQELRTWTYGHLLLLNLRHLVRPLYTGFPDTPQWEDYPPNVVLARNARSQGGVALYAHPALQFDAFPTGSLAGESVADVALGAIDALEVFCSHDEPSMELWYRFLNLGFKLGISGGSDAFLNNQFAFLAGGERVYAFTGKNFSYANWIEALKLGRSFATVGPLLEFEVDGHIAGSELQFGESTKTVPVHVQAISSIPMSRMDVVVNGRVMAMASSTTPASKLQWSGNIQLSQSSWIAARVWGPNNDRIANGPSRWSQRRSASEVLLAHTSPVYVTLRGKQMFSAEDRDFCLKWIDSLIERIRVSGKFADSSHRDEVLSQFARAHKVYAQMGTLGDEEAK